MRHNNGGSLLNWRLDVCDRYLKREISLKTRSFAIMVQVGSEFSNNTLGKHQPSDTLPVLCIVTTLHEVIKL